jgi:hypothetical protein
MRYEVMLVVESELAPRALLEELVSNLESLDDPENASTVESCVVLMDDEELAVYDRKESAS